MEKTITNPFLLQDQTVSLAQIELPKELRNKVVNLQCESVKGTCNVYLVGTCHVSSQSCKDVEAIISLLKPEVVFLELCKSRSHFLHPQAPRLQEMPRFTDGMVGMWKRNNSNAFETLGSLVMEKSGKELGVVPGSEFQSAYREVKKYGGKVILGDRPIKITCQRTWSKMSFWYKTKFVFISLLMLATTSLASLDMEVNNQVIDREFPSMAETLTHERDLYMASRLLEVAKECKSVVAVVGSAHVPGIQKNWRKPIAIESLMEVRATTSSSAMKLWTTVALAAGGIAFFSVSRLKR
ncbi:hypothetical protein SUGI_0343690 [Cryptomeria japonica]|uniref:uncharacterized protein LOC131079221 n=1 Tax=Cryptomeria japonica TaxID=3369 RepID=UPI002408BC58|nr:uncharacterized protein LOC131079221 [Cryptomeria japonica]GLJ19138.1 hypothetical protein SUGI_0343690 [Cryptomeria japonica]